MVSFVKKGREFGFVQILSHSPCFLKEADAIERPHAEDNFSFNIFLGKAPDSTTVLRYDTVIPQQIVVALWDCHGEGWLEIGVYGEGCCDLGPGLELAVVGINRLELVFGKGLQILLQIGLVHFFIVDIENIIFISDGVAWHADDPLDNQFFLATTILFAGHHDVKPLDVTGSKHDEVFLVLEGGVHGMAVHRYRTPNQPAGDDNDDDNEGKKAPFFDK